MQVPVASHTMDKAASIPFEEDHALSKHNNTEKRPTTASAGSRATPPKTNENTKHNLRKD